MTTPVRTLRIRRLLGAVAVCFLFSHSVEAASITLAWDPNAEPTLSGYILYYATTSGAVSGTYSNSIDVGNVTQWTIAGLTNGQQYYFALKAYDANGQSPFSAEISQVAAPADMTVTSAHTGNFTQGQVGASYALTVSDVAGAGQVVGTVTVVDTLPAGLTATAMSGTGWTCTVATATCTASGILGGGSSYPPITLTVNVSSGAAASVANSVTVSGGGETNTANDTGTDVTTINSLTADLTVASAHTGNFTQGQVGATYTLTVSNIGAAATAGTVTVVDTLPASLTATAMSGTGWTCTVATVTCTTSSVVASSGSYPAITLTVSVSGSAPSSVTNSVTVSGGGETNAGNDTGSDPTTVIATTPNLTVASTHSGSFAQGQVGATYTVTVSNVGNGSTAGTVTVVDTLPTGLTATALSGSGWTCTVATRTCTTSTVLANGASYPAITLTVTVASTALASVTNSVTVSGGGDTTTGNNTGTDATTVSPTVATVSVNPTSANLQVGQTVNLTGQAFDGNNNPMPSVTLNWSTSNAGLASLSATTGAAVTVTAAGVGSPTITVSASGKSATAAITVTPAPTIASVTVTPASKALLTGQTQQFVALAFDASNNPIAGAAFTWTTTSGTVAPLSATTGSTVNVTPTAVGTATIRATATSNETFAEATVTVTAPPTVTSVVITGATPNIALGDLRTLQAQGFDASNNLVPTAAFTWTTSASTIARLVANAGSSVDVQGYSAGSATITATETASTRSATATVTIATSDTVSWDTFTGTNGTALTAHAPDASQVGGGWTVSGSAAPTLQSGLARVTTAGTAASRIYATQDATLSDVGLATD